MPIPTVVCSICKKQVSKRSTLSLEVLGGGGDGRACRGHEQVVALAEACTRDALIERQIGAAVHRLRVMSLAAGIRMMNAVNGWPIESFYERMQSAGSKQSLIDEVRAEITALGGPMTAKEFGEAMFVGLTLMERKQ